MRINSQQLRQLIESSVIKRDDDYVAPVEAPLTDPRDFDFDLSDENKKKLFDLVGGDDASQAQADSLADTLEFPSSGRFGADTLSKQTKMYDMGLDVINDSEIDRILDRAIELYFNDYGKYLADDLFHVLQAGYKYPEGPGGFKLFLEGDTNFNKEDLDTELDVTFFHPKTPAIRTDMVYAAMRKMYVLISIAITGIQDSMYEEGISALELLDDSDRAILGDDFSGNVEELAPEYLKQRFEKFKKAKELFKKRTMEDRPPALTQHVYDKMMKPMYEIFTTAHKKFNPNQDMSRLKENKLKLSRRQLAGMIREMAVTPPSQDEENAAIIVNNLKKVGSDKESIIQFFQLAVDAENLVQEDTLDFMELYPSGLIVSFIATEIMRDELNYRITNVKSQLVPKTYPKLYKVAYLAR